MGAGRNWSNEDKEYLAEHWGHTSIPTLCKKLNRSKESIMNMRTRLHLGPFYEAGDYVTMHQLLLALGIAGGYGYKNISWIENRDFPVRYKSQNQQKVKIVYIDEFWKWAEKNQSFLDFSKFEENALGIEPEWAKLKRKLDKQKAFAYKNSPWTGAEDDYLKGLLKHYRYSYPELSKKLRRTEGAIQRRILDLGLKERPVKADNHNLWTVEQVSLLGTLIKQGYHYEAIHEKIPDKSVKAIRGYVYRFYLTENLDKVRSYIGNGTFGDNVPERQIGHFRVMSIEERYETKENVSQLAYLLIQIARQKSGVTEEFKDYWQKDMCMNWSDIHGCKAGETSCDSCDSFQRIRPQYCVRCGSTIYARQTLNVCDRCRLARKKQAQRKYAIMQKRNERREKQ